MASLRPVNKSKDRKSPRGSRVAERYSHSQKTKRFVILMFMLGGIFGALSCVGYVWYVKSMGKWDPSSSSFHAAILLWGLGFVFPCLTISLRLMVQTVTMSAEGLEKSKEMVGVLNDVQSSVQPIINDIKDVVHKVRSTSDQISETLSPETIKNISTAIEKVPRTITQVRDWIESEYPKAKSQLERFVLKSIDDLLGKVMGD